MRRLAVIVSILLLSSLSFAANIDVDLDSNDKMDIAYGGTNAGTAADARANLGLLESAIAPTGIQSIKVEWASTSSLTIGAGVIHINNGADHIYTVTSSFAKTVTSLSTSTWYYLYVDPPDSGYTIASGDIEYSTTAPTLDEDKRGYYHGTNTDWRCIGAFYSDGSSNVYSFYNTDERNVLFVSVIENDQDDDTPSNTWTDQTLTVPLIGSNPVATGFVRIKYIDTNAWANLRVNGDTLYRLVGYIASDAIEQLIPLNFICDSSGKVETRFDTATAGNLFKIFTTGYVIPPEIYTGPTNIGSSLSESEFKAWEVVGEYELSSETANITISNVQGNTYDRWLIDFVYSTSATATGLGVRFNGDTGTNYKYGYIVEANDATLSSFTESASTTSALIGYADVAGEISGKTQLFLKTGIQRTVFSSFLSNNSTDNAAHIREHRAAWTDSSNEVTSINIFSDDAITGTIKVYKFKKVYLPDTRQVAIGTQSLKLSYASTSSLTVGSGKIHIYNGTRDETYELPVDTTLNVSSLSTSTWYYVYIDPPASGYRLSSSDIEYSSTAPTLNSSKKGYYHGTNTDWRCIGAFYSDGSGNVYSFYNLPKNKILYDSPIANDQDDETPSNTWTDQTLTVPLIGDNPVVVLFIRSSYIDAAGFGQIRTNGSSGWHNLGYIESTSTEQSVRFEFPCDSTGKVETRFENASAGNELRLFTEGYVLPEEIYTGTVAGGGSATTPSTRTLVAEYNPNDATLDETISGISGDTDDTWEIEAHFANTDTSNARLSLQFNSDTSTNYNFSYYGVNNAGAASVGDDDSESAALLCDPAVGDSVSSHSMLFLKSGIVRQIFTQKSVAAGQVHSLISRWTNTANEVTSIRIFNN